MRKQRKCTHRAVRRKQCRNPIVLIRLTEPITNTAGAFSQHFQVIFSQCDTHCFHASFISDSFFPVQSILFMNLITGTIPLKSLPFPSVSSSSSCSRAGQMENQIINNDRASLAAQWLRICLPMQGTRVRALVWEDPTCRGATRPVSHNY